jgi:hypothetical protein
LGGKNQPAYIATFDGALTNNHHGARVYLKDERLQDKRLLLGMLYLTEEWSEGKTRGRIFPAHMVTQILKP